MKRRGFMALALAGIMAGSLLTACKASEKGEGTSAAKAETDKSESAAGQTAASQDKPFAGQSITWTDTGAGDWEDSLEPILAKFEEITGAKVKVELYSHQDYLDMLQVKLESGSDDYDVVGIDVPLVASYVVRDWIVPLDEYFTEEEKAQFNDSALQAGSWDGKFYAPAMNSSSQILWYNTALLKEAGVEVPESSTEKRLTWEQVEALAKETLKKIDPDGAKGIAGITFGQVSRTYQMNEIPNSLGGKNIGDDGYTAEGIINSQAWIDGATWYQNLYKDGVSLKGFTADNAGDFFRAGKAVFIVDGTWMANSCERDGMKDYAYAPVPAFEGHEALVGTPTGSWHFGIPGNAKNKALAAEFVKYMSIGEGNTMWLKGNGDVPATKAGVDEMMNSTETPGYMKIAAYESANTAVPRALTPGYTEYDTIIHNTWEDIKNGAQVKPALDGAAAKIDKAMVKWKNK